MGGWIGREGWYVIGWRYRISDRADRWVADDKLAHFSCAAWMAIALGLHTGPLVSLLATIGAGVLVELIEVVRWRKWNGVGSWPFLCDKISPKDLMYDIAGALAGVLFLLTM